MVTARDVMIAKLYTFGIGIENMTPAQIADELLAALKEAPELSDPTTSVVGPSAAGDARSSQRFHRIID